MQEMTNRLTLDLERLAFEHHDACVSCGYKFQNGDTSHLGYGCDDQPLYVCNKCSKTLKETAVRYSFSKRPYTLPEPNSKLWRYMDFTKYVSLLYSRGLYFTRADCFADRYEGAKGLKKNREKWDTHFLEFFRNAIRNPPPGSKNELSDVDVENQAQRLFAELECGGETAKQRTFINCWHESEHESEAMWRLYSNFLPNAIAVRTTYEKLYRSLGRNPNIGIGRVQYVDFNRSYAGLNNAFWRKRKSFEHEREVRAITYDHNWQYQGKLLACNLDLLIEEVFVSPQAPTWFEEIVNDLTAKYGIHKAVSTSELIEEPFF